MTSFAKAADRRVNELWNVSLLPLSVSQDAQNAAAPPLGKLENIDERRSQESFRRPLRVSPEASSVILVLPAQALGGNRDGLIC
jgi:hypothetical protein